MAYDLAVDSAGRVRRVLVKVGYYPITLQPAMRPNPDNFVNIRHATGSVSAIPLGRCLVSSTGRRPSETRQRTHHSHWITPLLSELLFARDMIDVIPLLITQDALGAVFPEELHRRYAKHRFVPHY